MDQEVPRHRISRLVGASESSSSSLLRPCLCSVRIDQTAPHSKTEEKGLCSARTRHTSSICYSSFLQVH